MSKTLNITWDNPTPHPACGYLAFYHRNLDMAYSEIITSGSTSGTTSVSTVVSAPACFDGYTIANCCEGNTSIPTPFGINSYVPMHVNITTGDHITYAAVITTEYPNPYDTIVAGSFVYTAGAVPHTVLYRVVYPSGSTLATISTGEGIANLSYPISNIVVTDVLPIYDNNGTIQQYDTVGTPAYFEFYWDGSSGVTWNGSPASLPSMVQVAFDPVEVDSSGNTLIGNLLLSWIYSSIYASGVPPYDFLTLEVYDPGNNLLGTSTISTATIGLRTLTMTLTLADPSHPLTGNTQFRMLAKWNDETVIDNHVFYLPIP